MNDLVMSMHGHDRGVTHESAAASDSSAAAVTAQSWARWKRKMSTDEINAVELVSYSGPIHLVRSHAEMLEAVRILQRQDLLGFDTETRPSFRKGVVHKPAILQLGGPDGVYLFRLRELGLPRELIHILSDPEITKAGVAVGRDVRELRQMEPFEPAGFVDLGECGRKAGIQHHGLRGMAAVVLDCRISKGARTTNWDRQDLPMHSLRYAATDAWIAHRLFLALKKHGCPLPSLRAAHWQTPEERNGGGSVESP